MKINKLKKNSPEYIERLKQLHDPPKQLFWAGANLSLLLKNPVLTVVGSRKVSPYGRQVTEDILGKLSDLGIVIVSGLAFGIDAIAHQSALKAGGKTIAVLPSPLDKIVPVYNQRLAQQILDNGGTLVSEYASGNIIHKQNFIARNRIMAALGNAILITEAAEKSGTLHTARFALEQGKTVLVVPGDIYKDSYRGCNNLIKQGATPVTSHHDVLAAFGLTDSRKQILIKGRNDNEQAIIDTLRAGFTDANDIIKKSNLEVSNFNVALVMLEIDGKIKPLGGNHWSLA
jgi:DNA processing protein